MIGYGWCRGGRACGAGLHAPAPLESVIVHKVTAPDRTTTMPPGLARTPGMLEPTVALKTWACSLPKITVWVAIDSVVCDGHVP